MERISGEAFAALCQVFNHSSSVSRPRTLPSPAGSPFDSDQLRAAIQKAIPAMPAPYRCPYGSELAENIGKVTEKLKQESLESVLNGASEGLAWRYAKLRTDTAVGAVTDWANPECREQLEGFAAVASDLFRSFVHGLNDQDEMVGQTKGRKRLEITTKLPPLVTFAPSPVWGPTTLTSAALSDLDGPSIGVVSLPLSYQDDPMTWGILAHEVCGHDTVHAIKSLMAELHTGIGGLEGLSAGWAHLWQNWGEEAVADVFGIMNIGPHYAVGLAAWLSAYAGSDSNEPIPLGCLRTRFSAMGGTLLDDHPIDILRLHLCIGAIRGLLSPPIHLPEGEAPLDRIRICEWITRLEAVAQNAAAGRDNIDLIDGSGIILQQYSRKALIDDAERVGEAIATMHLSVLGDSIQSLEIWSSRDEEAVDKIIATGSIASVNKDPDQDGDPDIDDAILIAGALGGLLKDCSEKTTQAARQKAYSDWSDQLRLGFRLSYERDPLLNGSPKRHSTETRDCKAQMERAVP